MMAAVVGGGIAGLACTMSLAQAGWQVWSRSAHRRSVRSGLQRQRLHQALREAAAAAGGIELVTGAAVTAVVPGAPRGEPAAVTWTTGNQARTVRADLVVAADGVRTLCGRSCSWMRALATAAARAGGPCFPIPSPTGG